MNPEQQQEEPSNIGSPELSLGALDANLMQDESRGEDQSKQQEADSRKSKPFVRQIGDTIEKVD